MTEIWKTVIERISSWPVAAVVLALLFGKHLRALLDRIELFQLKRGEIQFSASGKAVRQLEAQERSVPDPLAPQTSPQQLLDVPEEIAKRKELVRTYGGENPLLLSQVQGIKQDLERLQFPLGSPETTEVLLRHLAAMQLLQRAEFLYRVIFGSQVSLLHKLNDDGPQPEDCVRSFFEKARNRSPRFYSDYTFDQWIEFLIQQQVVIREKDRYAITNYGREFLGFVVSQGLPKKTH